MIQVNLHIQADICSHHAEGHEHFHDKLNRQTSLASCIFHTHTTEAAYNPTHQLRQFGAAEETKQTEHVNALN